MVLLWQTIRYLGKWLKRNIATVVIVGFLGFTLCRNIHIPGTVFHFKNTDALHKQDLQLRQQLNTSMKQVTTKKVHSVAIPRTTRKPDRYPRNGYNKYPSNGYNRYPSNGYDRAKFLRKACEHFHERNLALNKLVRVSYDIKHETLYCPLCKLASTFWTRVFKMLERNRGGWFIKHPYEVPILNAPASRLHFDTSTQKVGRTINANNSFKFLFVRNPYSLLFSAFVDKIVGPNPSFWKEFGQSVNPWLVANGGRFIRSCGDKVTFEQFLRNIIYVYKTRHSLNCHVAKFDACQPCKMNYTFVAKMETFKADTFHILSKLNQTQTLEIFEDEFSDLHADDAIEDSTSGPYSWKKDIIRCIPWHEALQRIWRKLQIRGVIGMGAFPLDNEEADGITREDFIKLLKKTRQETSSSERSWQKEQALKEAYRDVPNNILDEIRKIYAKEFYLFDYNGSPEEIFDKNVPFHYYGFMDYNNVKQNITYKV